MGWSGGCRGMVDGRRVAGEAQRRPCGRQARLTTGMPMLAAALTVHWPALHMLPLLPQGVFSATGLQPSSGSVQAIQAFPQAGQVHVPPWHLPCPVRPHLFCPLSGVHCCWLAFQEWHGAHLCGGAERPECAGQCQRQPGGGVVRGWPPAGCGLTGAGSTRGRQRYGQAVPAIKL